jgi:HD superfamily phosphohydrolase YqeK
VILHPIVEAASSGQLPDWASAGRARRAHMERVGELLDAWAAELGLGTEERGRWRAAGWLHDVLRDQDPEVLRPQVPGRFRSYPGPILHGPAAAAKLRAEGVEDDELLDAVSFHTIGDAGLGRLGRALYAADFLEPGRSSSLAWRSELRDRMPAEMDAVLLELVESRVAYLTGAGRPVLPETAAFLARLESEGQ